MRRGSRLFSPIPTHPKAGFSSQEVYWWLLTIIRSKYRKVFILGEQASVCRLGCGSVAASNLWAPRPGGRLRSFRSFSLKSKSPHLLLYIVRSLGHHVPVAVKAPLRCRLSSDKRREQLISPSQIPLKLHHFVYFIFYFSVAMGNHQHLEVHSPWPAVDSSRQFLCQWWRR